MKKTFGKHLRQLRKFAGYTQQQMADKLFMSPSGYASWEQGVSEPSIENILALIEILEVSHDEFLIPKNY